MTSRTRANAASAASMIRQTRIPPSVGLVSGSSSSANLSNRLSLSVSPAVSSSVLSPVSLLTEKASSSSGSSRTACSAGVDVGGALGSGVGVSRGSGVAVGSGIGGRGRGWPQSGVDASSASNGAGVEVGWGAGVTPARHQGWASNLHWLGSGRDLGGRRGFHRLSNGGSSVRGLRLRLSSSAKAISG